MPNEFTQIQWDDDLRQELREIVRLAIREDIGAGGDLTSLALVPEGAAGRAAVTARRQGVVAGLPAAEEAVAMVDPRLAWTAETPDGQTVEPQQPVALIAGPARSLLAAERLVLNLLSRLSGIATLTRRYVEAVAGTKARIYDTRKTTPGWRRLEKYAVRCGGGWNHRTGLFDAVLIKDNHLALEQDLGSGSPGEGRPAVEVPAAAAVRKARGYVESLKPPVDFSATVIEVEVDSLDGLESVLRARPDVILLDNMSPEELRRAVAVRDAARSDIPLEASGGIDLATVSAVAAAGVDRISVGALTHSAVGLDFGLDWLAGRS